MAVIEIGLLSNSEMLDNFKSFLFLAIFFGLIIYISLSSTPYFKGKKGERKVQKRLNRLAKKYDGYLINNVTIPAEGNGISCQIDHILFSTYGIFVIETKNYSGYIYGNDSQQEWTQVLQYGKVKNKFYNPVKQNATHCYRLKAVINDDKLSFNSAVVFVRFNGGNISSSSVISLSKIRKLINKESKEIYSREIVLNAYNKILFYKENPISSNREHIREIKENLKSIQNGICPRCGGKLVLRKNKNGKFFYGCDNYPRCKFVKKY